MVSGNLFFVFRDERVRVRVRGLPTKGVCTLIYQYMEGNYMAYWHEVYTISKLMHVSSIVKHIVVLATFLEETVPDVMILSTPLCANSSCL